MSSAEGKCDGVQQPQREIFWYLGVLLACWLAFKLLRSLWRGLYTCFLADLLGHTVNWRTLGEWAVITGATDGIGKSYAKALAAKKFNIVLVSRNPEKLQNVANEIESKYGVKTKISVCDVTDDITVYDSVRQDLEGLDIGVLVNNVGMSYPYAEYLTKVPNVEKFADDLIKANITSVNKMILMVLPRMEAKKRGVIINISSLSALSPTPLLSVYGASKAYVNLFTRALEEEYKKKGIIFQSVLPGFVSTNMSKMRPSLTICTPDAFVRWALKSVGVEERSYGYPMHKLQGYAQELIAEYLPENLNLAINHRVLRNLRKRYYKKHGLTDTESQKPDSAKTK